jgi:membrane-bound lytic murein transglycosylase B
MIKKPMIKDRYRQFLACCLLATTAPLASAHYAALPAAQHVITAAADEGVDAQWATDVLTAASRQQSILDAIARPAEKTKPWHEYRQIFLTKERIAAGAAFAREYADTLSTVSRETGVPAALITAIIGVETYYGRITGNYRVIDALATLAFDYPKRSPFFTKELVHFLVLAHESGKDPLSLKGSYAGAMGYGQFMPSSYRAYAIDHDGDNVIDIWDNPADAIASVANYFLAHGWQPGEPVVVPAVNHAEDEGIFEGGLKPRHTVAALEAMGFRSSAALAGDQDGRPMKLQGEEDWEYWLGLHNFYVITRYNHSAMYALAVWQLSEAITAALDEAA